jgi:hypothetical protein
MAAPPPDAAIPVYAMLPLDAVNGAGEFTLARAPWFARALSLLGASGVTGVAVDVWVSYACEGLGSCVMVRA